MQAVQEQLSALAEKIQSLNLVLAMPELEAVERDVLSRALWDALDEEAELYNQLSSLSSPQPQPEPVIEQVKPEPETVTVEDVQKEDEAPKAEQPDPVPTYVIEQVQTDIKQYTEQLEVFDKAIETQAFAELPEHEQARRLRARDHLAGYLEESQAELESFGPLFDELNVIKPAEELEQELERQNAPDLASDFDVLFNSEPEPEQVIESEPVKPLLMQLAQLKFACPFCKANADVVDADEGLIDVVCSTERKHYALVKKSGVSWVNKRKDASGSGESGNSCGLPMFVYSAYSNRDQVIDYADAMRAAIDSKIENLLDPNYTTAFIPKKDLLDETELAKEIFNRFPQINYRPWALALHLKRPDLNTYLFDIEREILPQLSDLASKYKPICIDAEPEITKVVSTTDELADLQAKVSQAKALAEKNQQLQSEKAVIESELSDLERQLDQIFSGGYNEFSDIEAAKIQREIEVRQRCRREIMAHFESPDSIVPAWAKWQDRIDELTPLPEPEVLEPVKPAKPKPAVKPVKVDLIGSVSPTRGQLSKAVLEILSRDPHFANREMLDLSLPGAPWLFDVNTPHTREMLTSVLEGLIDNRVIVSSFTMNGEMYRLPKFQDLSTPSEPEPASNEPRCDYCNGDMQAINGNPGQWRCLGNSYHSFYVSNGRGVWVDNSGTFDKQITDLPSWAKKEG